MSHEEIVTQLSVRMTDVVANPSEIVFAVTMRDVLSEIAHRMRDQALTLTVADLLAARDEVRTAFAHHLDERDYIQLGLDVWDVTRTL
ncbi:hypothetical protein [Geomonas propionica]|uniref:DUF507 family protein n=1 Tax=Geomonas propionica TaxID=2798582 RepID=A0ABS0YPC9_9BACT|nr:hypothetical protein [Geomonas propionica]MBJ6799748.1 hypothetical protein [Geomonas propionica]